MSSKLTRFMCFGLLLFGVGCREAKPGSSSGRASADGAAEQVAPGPRWLASRISANDHALGPEVGCEGGLGASGHMKWGVEDVQVSELSWTFRERLHDADVYEFRRRTALPCNTEASEANRTVVISELRQVYYFGRPITVIKDKFQEIILAPGKES